MTFYAKIAHHSRDADVLSDKLYPVFMRKVCVAQTHAHRFTE